MRHNPLLLILLSLLVVSTVTMRATDLRGRIDGSNGPLPGVGVALFAVLPNGSYEIVHRTVTGADGVYYFTGVRPGQYVLQIAGANYPVKIEDRPTQDLPIIQPPQR